MNPKNLFITYWTFSLFLFVYGPYNWNIIKPFVFFFLNFVYIFAFFVGWKSCVKKRSYDLNSENFCVNKKIIRNLHFYCFLNLILEFLSFIRRLGLSSFNLSELFKRILIGINNPADGYNLINTHFFSRVSVFGGLFLSVFNLVWDFFGFVVVLLSILYFFELKRLGKCFALCNWLIIILGYYVTGTNIGIFRLFLAFFVFIYIWCKRNHKIKTMFFIGLLICVMVLMIFNVLVGSRLSAYNIEQLTIGEIQVNKDSFILKTIPVQFHKLAIMVCGYICQGYQGMSLSLEIPWKPMFGFGHSRAIMQLFQEFFSMNLFNYTYQHRLSPYGWHETVRWHTMYSWYANDISYFGCIPLMFLYGRLFSKSYYDSIYKRNPYSCLMLYYMFLIGVFLPCNNQVFQTLDIMLSFYTICLCYFAIKHRKKFVLLKKC